MPATLCRRTGTVHAIFRWRETFVARRARARKWSARAVLYWAVQFPSMRKIRKNNAKTCVEILCFSRVVDTCPTGQSRPLQPRSKKFFEQRQRPSRLCATWDSCESQGTARCTTLEWSALLRRVLGRPDIRASGHYPRRYKGTAHFQQQRSAKRHCTETHDIITMTQLLYILYSIFMYNLGYT